MIGNHAAPVILDAYMKGLRDFDVEKAYEGMKKNATEAMMIPWRDRGPITELEKIWYSAGPLGICGDEDGGSMSSWYVYSAMGFYPVCPGRPIYNIGSPIFEKVTIKVADGKTFVIEAKNVSSKNKYIQSATLNDEPLNKPWFEHSAIVNGGKLTLHMGDRPNREWGSAPETAPPSMSF